MPGRWFTSIGHSPTNKRKTAILDDCRPPWASLGHLLPSSPKLLNTIDPSFQGHQSIQTASVEEHSEPFPMRGSLRTNFQLNPTHQSPGYTPRLQQPFKILTSSDPAHTANPRLPMDAVHDGENRLSTSPFIFEKQASKHWGTSKKQLQS